jgi:antitoxin component YwqK of YwqJK toxin-antitoxin module
MENLEKVKRILFDGIDKISYKYDELSSASLELYDVNENNIKRFILKYLNFFIDEGISLPDDEYIKYSVEGNKELQCTIKNGKLDGKYMSWYDNGEPFEICMYKEGELHGKYMKWNINGQPWVYSNYKEGKLDGEFKMFYNNGILSEHFHYENGLLHGDYKLFHENGELHKHRIYEKGEVIEWLKFKPKKL